MADCYECTSASDCSSCSIGTYFDSGTSQCEVLSEGVSAFLVLGDVEVECVGGCASCTSITDCEVCESGYYKTSQNICDSCHPLC